MTDQPEKPQATGNDMILSGLGVGAIGVAGAVILGATCPVCVVATPALIGVGLYQKWRARRLVPRPHAPDASGEEPGRSG